MEVAGLALGVYPAVVLAFQQYKQGAKYCRNWIRFRRRYEDFIHDTEGQQLFLEGILQDLMCNGPQPFLVGIKSKNDFVKIVRGRSYTGWRDPRLKLALTSRLGDKYDWCMYQIERIYRILAELQSLLDVQALSTSDKTPDWWKLQWERLKQSLSEARYEDLKEATRLITQLKEMVASCDGPQQAPESSSKLAPFFTKVRENALHIHTVLKNSWHCCCNSTHKAMLQLERRDDDRESEFNVLLIIPSIPASGTTKTAASTESIQQETCIRITSEIMEEEAEKEEKEQEEQKDAVFHDGSASSRASIGSAEHGLGQYSATLSSQSDNDRGDEWSAIQSWKSRLKRPFITKLKSKHKKQTKATVLHSKNKASIELELRNFTISGGLGAKDGLVATLKAVSIVETVPIYPNTTSIHVPEQPVDLYPIPDLCNLIHNSPGSKLGYLVDRRNKRHNLSQRKRPCKVQRQPSTITLKDLLEGNSHRFPPSKRAVVATILASSLLQLHRTHWLKDNWDKRDIIFKVSDDNENSVIYEQPYVSQEFISTKPSSKSSSAPEDEDLPKFKLRMALQCLAILLIELCFGEPIEQGKDRVRLKPTDTDDQTNRQYFLAIAHTWTEDEIEDHGPGFSDPIISCLNFPDIGRATRGQIDQVVEDIYSLIAKPLYDMTTRNWPNSFSYEVHR